MMREQRKGRGSQECGRSEYNIIILFINVRDFRRSAQPAAGESFAIFHGRPTFARKMLPKRT